MSPSKEKYYSQASKRFMMDAQLLRCRAAIHVESKDDISFWSTILEHFRPRDKFHFIAGSRNEKGNETKGVTQCLKYLSYLNYKFFICIDSDYRYLLNEAKMDVDHYVFQTYTYSFENHHCFSEGLNDICRQVTGFTNNQFDFESFLKSYSRIVYPLFLWHLYFLNADPKRFPISEFNELISSHWGRHSPDIRWNAKKELDKFENRINSKINALRSAYPKADLSILEKKYKPMGLLPETTYFFLRGHNIYEMVYTLNKEICKITLREAKKKNQTPREKINLFGYRNSIELCLKKNFGFGKYEAMNKIQSDIDHFFSSVPVTKTMVAR